jgi:hypothetical protein
LFDELAPQPLRGELTGLTLDEFAANIKPILAAQAAAPPPPLAMAPDTDLGRFREELAATAPLVLAAIEAIESGDAEAVAAFKSWIMETCAPAGQESWMPSCAELGVADGALAEGASTINRLFAWTSDWIPRATWTESLAATIDGSSPRLVAAWELLASEGRYLAFELAPGRTAECVAFSVGFTTATPILAFHLLDTCQDIFAEVRRYQDLNDGTMVFQSLDPALRE